MLLFNVIGAITWIQMMEQFCEGAFIKTFCIIQILSELFPLDKWRICTKKRKKVQFDRTCCSVWYEIFFPWRSGYKLLSFFVFRYFIACYNVLQEEASNEQCDNADAGPLALNAFDLIILSQGLNLSILFDRGQVLILKLLPIRPFTTGLQFLSFLQIRFYIVHNIYINQF